MSQGLRPLIRQLEDRGVLRVAGLYAAGSFVVLQVADLVVPSLPLPASAYDVVVLVTLAGFPVAVVVSWFFDLTDEGMRRSPGGLEEYERAGRPSGRRVTAASVALIAVLAVVAGGLLAFRLVLAPPDPGSRVVLAAFPFAASSTDFSEGVPDLLLTALDRAGEYADSLTRRNRLRLEASRALVATDGPSAAAALNRILRIDSTDLLAWTNLAYCHGVYGWQYEAGGGEAIREVREALETRAATGPLGRSTLAGLHALTVSDSALPALAERLARQGADDWVTPYRYLRVDAPARAEVVLRGVAGSPDPRVSGQAGAERFRLHLARGRLATLGRAMGNGSYGMDVGTYHRFVLAAALVDVGDSALAAQAEAALTSALPPDSALAYFDSYPVWWTAWGLRAYHAQVGDTAVARVWQGVIATFPPGGTSPDYRGSLQSDIEARLLARQGEFQQAVVAAERAYELWGIHKDNTYEALPEPQMRFHLASLRTATGSEAGAHWLFRSLIPPAAWFGFLTARSHYELGGLAETAGDRAPARRHHEKALALWDAAEGSAAAWREPAARALGRILAE